MTKQSKTFTRLVAAIVLLLVLAGCAPTRSLPPGTYATTLTDFYPGKWELTLAEGNRYSFTQDGSIVDEGHYTSTQDQIVFTYEKGPYACPGQETYIYKWAFDGKALTLTTVEDQCHDRNRVITAHPWSKQD